MLRYSPGSLTRRKIWDTGGFKRVSNGSTACAYRKRGMMLLLPRGIARYSVHPWHVCVELIHELICLVQVSDQRGTCLVEKPAKGALCL